MQWHHKNYSSQAQNEAKGVRVHLCGWTVNFCQNPSTGRRHTEATRNECWDAVRLWRNEIRKDKIQLGLNLAQDVRKSKRSFFKDINNKRKTKEIVSPLLSGAATLVTEVADKAEVVNGFFAQTATDKDSPQESPRGPRRNGWSPRMLRSHSEGAKLAGELGI